MIQLSQIAKSKTLHYLPKGLETEVLLLYVCTKEKVVTFTKMLLAKGNKNTREG